jgi:hypothetical protein
MGPGDAKHPVQFRVGVDGKPPGAARGVDVDDQGNGILKEPRMNRLIRQRSLVVARQF